MFNERIALERLFNELEQARERRYQQHLDEIRSIETKQLRLLDDLRRIDYRLQQERKELEQKQEQIHEDEILKEIEKEVAGATKKNLQEMTTDLLEKYPKADPFPKARPEKAIETIYENHRKIYPDNTIAYQTYYICPSCKDRGRLFIKQNMLTCFCRSCKKSMKVRHATSKGFPKQDDFGNYFVAGDFIRIEDRDLISLENPVDKILERYNKEMRAEQEQKRAGQEVASSDMSDTAIAEAFKETAKFSMN